MDEKKLLLAKRLIEEVKNSLVNESSICPCCKCERHSNWEAKQKKDYLNAAITRLEKVIAWKDSLGNS